MEELTNERSYAVLGVGTFLAEHPEIEKSLRGTGYQLNLQSDGAHAIGEVGKGQNLAVAILDLDLKGGSTYEYMTAMREKSPDTQMIVVSRTKGFYEAVEVNKRGAFWFLTEPYSTEEIMFLVAKACVVFELSSQNRSLRASLETPLVDPQLVGRSPAMRAINKKLERLSELDSNVLILGESGTGKSTLAQTIHRHSPRAKGPFISISCASIPRDLLEAELFGYEKGAFTGAYSSRMGSVEIADKGTLFLDEVGDLPLELQPKLLTFLQERSFRRLGSKGVRTVDIRIIAATNKDLKEMSLNKEFREDLYFRLDVVSLIMPPLRDRIDDIEEIAQKFLRDFAKRSGRKISLSKEALQSLKRYPWPGNIRELENALERASVFSESEIIEAKDLHCQASAQLSDSLGILREGTLEQIEKELIRQRLQAFDGNKEKAAKSLGVSLKTIYNKLKG